MCIYFIRYFYTNLFLDVSIRDTNEYIRTRCHIKMYVSLYTTNVYISNMHFICDMINAHNMGVKKSTSIAMAIPRKSTLVNTNIRVIHLLTSVLTHINSFQLQYALRKMYA